MEPEEPGGDPAPGPQADLAAVVVQERLGPFVSSKLLQSPAADDDDEEKLTTPRGIASGDADEVEVSPNDVTDDVLATAQKSDPKPGGYADGETVFFTGTSETFADGGKVLYGHEGKVAGPATHEMHVGKGVAVKFPDNKGDVKCDLAELRKKYYHPLTDTYSSSPTPPFFGQLGND